MGQPYQDQTLKPNEKGFPLPPASFLLSWFGLLAMLAGLTIAVWTGQTVMAILFGLVLSAAGLSKLWSRLSLMGVSCQRLLSEHRAFPGEYVELKLRVVNRKPLPLPWLQVNDEIPAGLASNMPLTSGNNPETGFVSKATTLPWYSAVSWRHRLYCNKRGYYTLGPTVLTSGDIFGFYPRSITEPSIDHIIVYPKIFSIAQLSIPSLYPLGETRAERRIFEDPTRMVGIRDYSPHDSLKRIHWKASARHQNLKSKVYEPTTTLKVALFLAIDSFQHNGGYDEDDFEMGLSLAASIANYVTEQDNSVGLFVNTRLADSGQPIIIPPASSTSQLVKILEALAKVTQLSSGPFDKFLQNERRGLSWGTTLAFIVSRPSESLTGLLTSLRDSGHKLLVLQIGKQEKGRIDHGVSWHNVGQHDLAAMSSKGIK